MKLFGKLLLLFTVITAIEIYLLTLLTQYTNIWVTLAMIIFPGMLGAYLAKREGQRAWKQIRGAMSMEVEPTTAVLDGAIILVAAAFLITPGVLTDITGLLLLIPAIRRPVREYAKKRIQRVIEQQLSKGMVKFFSMGNQTMPANYQRYSNDKVIDITPDK